MFKMDFWTFGHDYRVVLLFTFYESESGMSRVLNQQDNTNMLKFKHKKALKIIMFKMKY